MGKRDEFSASTREALEKRAGSRCSFPGCPAVTVGPSDESEISTSKSGTACHIAAAASGKAARRFVENMSKKERTSIENGIWMCATHGKLIDTDEHRFTISMLKKWREFAEFRAKFRQEFGADKPLPQDKLVEIGFANETLTLAPLAEEAQTIGYALLDSCVPIVWGSKLSDAVRDVLVEIVRNTFTHGHGSTCDISIGKDAIHVSDNGGDFSWLDLPNHKKGSGGAEAVKDLFSKFGDKLLLGAKRESDRNITTIALANSLKDLQLVAPCSTHVSRAHLQHIRDGELLASWFSSDASHCRIVYIVLPTFLPYSDAIRVYNNIRPEAIKGKQLVFVVPHASDGVRGYLLRRFPDSRMLNVTE